jgi:two-component system response regulator VicR
MSLKALVVDDEPSIRLLFTRLLERMACTVHQAIDGLEAETLVPQLEPDLILLDIMMVRQDGYETCQHLRDKGYAGTIIMVSALSRETGFQEAKASGADDYLQKPVTRQDLQARIDALNEKLHTPTASST